MSRNAELFRRIADQIAREPSRYDQAAFQTPKTCGTAYCIGGWAIALTKRDDEQWPYGFEQWAAAKKALGIDEDEALSLFDEEMTPVRGTVPNMLRAIADGARIQDVCDSPGQPETPDEEDDFGTDDLPDDYDMMGL